MRTQQKRSPITLFCSYADADEKHREKLEKHLSVLIQENIITLWHRGKIQLGDGTQQINDEKLSSAQLILLLISTDFLASSAYKAEIERALQLSETGSARVIPIILHPVDWQPAAFAHLQVLPRNNIPVTGWSDDEGAFANITREIRLYIEQWNDPPEQTILLLEAPPRNPYKGLQAFRMEDAQDFFGRDDLIARLLGKVQQLLTMEQLNQAGSPRLLTVLGPSGSGKSSVVMAGLLPKLKQGRLTGSENWTYLCLERIAPEKSPLEALSEILISIFPGRGVKSIQKELQDNSPRGLHSLLEEYVKQSGKRVLLMIDQLEELLFPQTDAKRERQEFLDIVLAATRGPLIGAVLVLRADFCDDRLFQYSGLKDRIESNQVTIPPMERRDLRKIIEQPAQLRDVQLIFEKDLVSELLLDVQDQVGALPLLQFTLDQLFEHREGRLMTLQAYHQISGVVDNVIVKGIKGALVQFAEATYQHLSTEEKLIRALFLRLVNSGEREGDTIRYEVQLSEFVDKEKFAEVTNAFTKARLLTAKMVKGKSGIEVSHGALIQVWSRLQDWRRDAQEEMRLQRLLSRAVDRWKEDGRRTDQLYRGLELKRALRWKTTTTPLLISIEEDRFLQDSSSHERRTFLLHLMSSMLIVIAVMSDFIAKMFPRSDSPPILLNHPNHPISPISPYTYTKHTGSIESVAWSPDSKSIASGSWDKTVQIWDAHTGNLQLRYTGHTKPVESVAWSPDSERIASGSWDTTVQVWDASTGNLQHTYTGHTSYVASVAWSSDGERIASGSWDTTVQVWDASTGSPLLTCPSNHTEFIGFIQSVAWSSDGERIASGSWDSTVQVWDSNTDSRPLFSCIGHISSVRSVAWSPDGKRIASGSEDTTVRIWDASNGNFQLHYTGHTEPVESVAWSPDSKRIASGSWDKTVQVWDARTGNLQHTYTGHKNIVRCVAWSPDGKRIASGSEDTTVQVWDAIEGS